MKHLKAFGAFWYDFIIGDDWVVALGVVVALTVTWVASHHTTIATWWIVPVAALALLGISLLRATHTKRRPVSPSADGSPSAS
jgi:hypothetical protein